MININRPVTSLCLILAAFVSVSFAQLSSVDSTFAPAPSAKLGNEDLSGKGIVVQADGKPIIFGGNPVVDGVIKGQVARLNVNGSLDTSFSYCDCLTSVTNVKIQADGKILVAGSLNQRATVVRLNSDGSQDLSFVTAIDTSAVVASSASLNTIQSDGKILIQYTYQLDGGFHAGYVYRLNQNGTTDGSFTPIGYDGGRLIIGTLTALALDPSGKIYIAIKTSSGGSGSSILRRYNADGTLDNTWTQPNFTPSTNSEYNWIAVQPDGALLISGRFDSVNGLSKVNLVRVLPAGNVDMDFTAPTLGSGSGQLALLPDGKILVHYHITGNFTLTRLNSNGSTDPTFVLSSSVNTVNSRFVLDSSGRILFFGLSNLLEYRYFRLNPNGDEDTSFVTNVTKFANIRTVAIQPDGKVLLAGNFIQLNGVPRRSVGRVNADGMTDTTFDVGAGFDTPPQRLLVQADGKIVAAGGFTTYNGSPRPGLVRLNSDGSLDASFAPAITGGSVWTASLQSDGRILIGGNFTNVDGTSRTGVARLNVSGTLDDVFNVIVGSPSISEVFQQPDGKIMIGGGFNGVNGFNRSAMARLNDNGSLDQTFDAAGIGIAERIYLQADGKYLVTTSTTLRRRNSFGGADASFPTIIVSGASINSIDTLIIQPDGSIIMGGSFNTVNEATRRNIVRITPLGAVDTLFFPTGANGPVRSAARQPDGKIVIGGEFSRVENIIRDAVARLNVAPLRRPTPFDFDGDGRADISVVRPSTNRWYELLSSTGGVYEETFGVSGDVLAPADFDGDGITDEAVYRPGSTSQWWYRSSITGNLVLNQFGGPTDIPRPSDFDGDGKADFVLFRPTGVWLRIGSMNPTQAITTNFGLPGDQPLVGDFDGDGKGDLAIFRPSSGDWWYAASSAGGAFRTAHWGQNGDIPVPADYDGDGKTDYAVYRPSQGGWYIYNSSNGSFTTTAFGINGDRPVAADYDGDGRADIAVFRPSTGIWYLLRSTSGFAGYQFGLSTDVALPGALIP